MTTLQSSEKIANATPKIIILGGYGAVGSLLTVRLAKQYPGAVVIAGRDGKKAKALSDSIPGTAHITIDVGNPKTYIPIFAPENHVRVVISCVELSTNSTLAQEVLAHGIHFTELTATYETHKKVLALQKIAVEHKSTAVVGVGLMPGLSNIMANNLAKQLDVIDQIEINLMLGLGDGHGLDAVKWTLRNLTSHYEIAKGNQLETVESFSNPCKATFIDEKSPRHFYRFDFSDQHLLTRSIKAKQINSRLAFDSRLATRSLGWLRKIGVLSLVKDKYASVAHKIMNALPTGSDQWALQVEAHGLKENRRLTLKLLARGRAEGDATAIIAAYVVSQLYDNKLISGVHAIEEVLDAKEVYAHARQNNVMVSSLEPQE